MPVWAQPQIMLLGVGASGQSFVGAGDIDTGAFGWWGLRAYSGLKAGTKAANVCNASDVSCVDINTLANGKFDVVTAQASPLSCTSGACTIKTLYDQTGSTNCSSSACDLTQATISLRPTLTFNCLGTTLPCAAFTSTQSLKNTTGITSTQPYTMSAVGERTSSFTSSECLLCAVGGTPSLGFSTTANAVFVVAGTGVSLTGNPDSAFHAIQGLLNGASSILYSDGVSSGTVSAGTSTATTLCVGACTTRFLTGNFVEAGIWPGSLSANFSTMNSNQHTYWGF